MNNRLTRFARRKITTERPSGGHEERKRIRTSLHYVVSKIAKIRSSSLSPPSTHYFFSGSPSAHHFFLFLNCILFTMATSTPTDQSNKNHVGDDTENQLGISVYLTKDHDGFSAVSKARYSDFVVHEVGPDGSVARLDSMDAKIDTDEKTTETVGIDDNSSNRKRKRN